MHGETRASILYRTEPGHNLKLCAKPVCGRTNDDMEEIWQLFSELMMQSASFVDFEVEKVSVQLWPHLLAFFPSPSQMTIVSIWHS